MLVDSFQNRLKRIMEIRNLKQVDLVERTGIDKTLLNKYLSGNSNARQGKISLLSTALNVNEAWLMGYDVPMERNLMNNISTNAIEVIKVPVLGKISAGVPILAEESFEGYALAPATYIKTGKEYFYLRVQGDSMNLKCPDGSIVLVEKTEYIEDGDIGVIAVNGYDATIKKYHRKGDLVVLEPMSSNPEYTTQFYDTSKVQVHILGKAISYQGDF